MKIFVFFILLTSSANASQILGTFFQSTNNLNEKINYHTLGISGGYFSSTWGTWGDYKLISSQNHQGSFTFEKFFEKFSLSSSSSFSTSNKYGPLQSFGIEGKFFFKNKKLLPFLSLTRENYGNSLSTFLKSGFLYYQKDFTILFDLIFLRQNHQPGSGFDFSLSYENSRHILKGIILFTFIHNSLDVYKEFTASYFYKFKKYGTCHFNIIVE